MGKEAKKKKSVQKPDAIRIAFMTAILVALVAFIVLLVVDMISKKKNEEKALAASATPTPAVEENKIEFAANEAVRFKDQAMSMEEFMLYAVPIVNESRAEYGDDWSEPVDLGDGTYMTRDELVKCNIIDTAILTKALSQKFEDDGHELSEEEEEEILHAAEDYLESLKSAGLQDDDLPLTEVYGYMWQNYRAQAEYVLLFGQDADITDEGILEQLDALADEYRGEDFNVWKNVNWDMLDLICFDGSYDLVNIEGELPMDSDPDSVEISENNTEE